MVEALGPSTLDAVLINQSTHDPVMLAQYAADGVTLLQPRAAELVRIPRAAMRPIGRNYTEHT